MNMPHHLSIAVSNLERSATNHNPASQELHRLQIARVAR